MYGKTFLKGIGYYFFAEILCLFLSFTLVMLGNIFFRILCAICSLGVLICLCINFAVQCEKDNRKIAGNIGMKPALLTGLAASAVYLLLYVLLLLSKIQILPDGIYRIYKMLNAPTLMLCNFLNPGVSTADLSTFTMVILFLLSLIPMAISTITYRLSANGVLPEDFLYRKK